MPPAALKTINTASGTLLLCFIAKYLSSAHIIKVKMLKEQINMIRIFSIVYKFCRREGLSAAYALFRLFVGILF